VQIAEVPAAGRVGELGSEPPSRLPQAEACTPRIDTGRQPSARPRVGRRGVDERLAEQGGVEVTGGVHVGLFGVNPARDPCGLGAFIGHWRRLSFISKVMRTIVMSSYVDMCPC
jgi:hypothetical protein